MKCYELKDRWFWAYPTESVDCDGITGSAHEVYGKSEVDAAIAELKRKLQDQCISCPVKMQEDDVVAELKQNLEDAKATAYADSVDAGMENRRLKRALWLMTAEWAEGMGLASCNIAIKLSFKERFFYHDEANREKDIKKYKHRQVVFYKYADYCRAMAEKFK